MSALGPLDRARRRRLGDRPAVPRHLLHPHGQGFWWLFVEPPLLVIAVGLVLPLLRRAGTAARTSQEERCNRPVSTSTGCSRRASCCSALCLLAEAIVGNGGLAAARVARVPLAGARVRARRPHVAGDDLLHELDDPHARARRVGAGDDARRRGRARARQREAAQPLVASGDGRRRSSSPGRVPRARAEPWLFQRSSFLHHLLGWTLVIGAVFPLARAFRPRSSCARRASRSCSSSSPSRSTAIATSRRSSGTSRRSRGAAPMRRAARSIARRCRARRFRRRRSRMRRSLQTKPAYRERLDVVAAHGRAALRPGREGAAELDPLSLGRRHRLARTAHRSRRPHRSKATLQRLPKGAYTVRWHALSRRARRLGRLDVRRRRAAPPPTEAYGASGPTRTEHVVRWLYFLALALLVGGLGFRLLVLRGRPAAARRVALLSAHRARRRRRARGRHRRVPAARRGRAAAAVRPAAVRRPVADRARYALRHGVHRDDARLRARRRAALPRLADRPRGSCSGPRSCVALGFASGLSLSGHSAADAGSSWKSQLADWVHLSAACLWLGGLVQLALVVWPLMPELRREAFLRYSRLATVCVALLVPPGST